jgi:hypothetical membrane protein
MIIKHCPKRNRVNTTLILVPILILVIFLLPFYSALGYSIVENSISELGAQKTPSSYIMNTVFVLLGMSIFIEVLRKNYFSNLEKTFILLFGISLTLTGIFSIKPIDPILDYNQLHNQLHSLFATIAGFSITLFAIIYGLKSERTLQRIIAFSVGIMTTFIPILMYRYPEYQGILQRFMFIATFTWLAYIFSIRKKEDL